MSQRNFNQLVDQDGILLSSFDLLDRVHLKKPIQHGELHRKYQELKSAFLGLKPVKLNRTWPQLEKLLLDDFGRLLNRPIGDYEDDQSEEEDLNLENLMEKVAKFKGNGVGGSGKRFQQVEKTSSTPITTRYRNKVTLEVNSSSHTDLGEVETLPQRNPPSPKTRLKK